MSGLRVFSFINIILIIFAISFGYRGTSFSEERMRLQTEYLQAKINSSYLAKYNKTYADIIKLLPNILLSKNSRFAMRYPSNWEYLSGNGYVMFKGKEGTLAYLANINVQTIAPFYIDGTLADSNQILNTLQNQFSNKYSNIHLLESGSINLTELDGTPISGRYIIFTFSNNGLAFKQWQVVLPRSDGRAFYAWTYTTPLVQYQTNLTIAQQMLNTLSIY